MLCQIRNCKLTGEEKFIISVQADVNYRGQSGKFGHIYQNSDKQVGTVRADQSVISKTININN